MLPPKETVTHAPLVFCSRRVTVDIGLQQAFGLRGRPGGEL